MLKKLLLFVLDIGLSVSLVLGLWYYHYLIPRAEKSAPPVEENVLAGKSAAGGVLMGEEDWRGKFANQFTEEVISTDTSYTSPDLSIHLYTETYDTGKMDTTENGKHRKYGSRIAYTLADIYVGNITCFQTAFAQDTYGTGYTEKLSDMSA